MPGLTEQLLMYYLGVGFAVVLAWAAALPNRQLDPDDSRRYLRRATAAAIVGLAHPASRSPPATSSPRSASTSPRTSTSPAPANEQPPSSTP